MCSDCCTVVMITPNIILLWINLDNFVDGFDVILDICSMLENEKYLDLI